MTAPSPPRWTRLLAAGLGAFASAEVVAGVAMSVALGWTFGQALDAFVVTNSVMGVAFGLCGAIIAWHRPRNPIGWLFAADGIGHAATAVGAPLAQVAHDAGAPMGVQRLVATAAAYAWPWSIALFLPLALLLFPTGRALSRRWRPVNVVVVATAPLFVLAMGSAPGPFVESIPVPTYLSIPSYDELQPLWTLAEVRNVALLMLAIVVLVLRYRRATETVRRQLLWLLLATVAMLVFTLPWGFVAGTPVVVLFAIPLIPVAVTVAIIRHRLFDIRLVVSRALAWTTLSAIAVVAYVALVALFDTVVSERFGRSAVVTVIVALLAAPLLPRLQRGVDRLMYGDRRDPAEVASRVGEQLSTRSASDLSGVALAIRDALRLPFVAVAGAAAGERPAEHLSAVPLEYGGADVGTLEVGLRPGERALSDADLRVLRLLAAPLAAAVHATGLSEQLQVSRERIVAAQEEERRRLRRDLHDGLGPTLTGVALSADAAANLVDSDASRAKDVLAGLRKDARTALADVRRIIEDLRPPALDELGLLGALRQRAQQLRWRADGEPLRVELEVPEALPPLPAAVEVAGYRIVTEALNNVVRHSRASVATMRVRVGDDSLDLEVIDNGHAGNGCWRPGVGLEAMRERAGELGGRFEAVPSAAGGRVSVWLPLEVR